MFKPLLLLLCHLTIKNYALQCMDDNNKPVDWFVAYKLPKLKETGTEYAKDGLAYAYMTSANHKTWIVSDKSMNQTTSIIGNTIKQLYEQDVNNYLYIVYNDQPPNDTEKLWKGHNKGVVLSDAKSGFWLVHSVPHFPVVNTSYQFPATGERYGQSFLCISLDLKNLNEVGIQLQYNEPGVYANNIPASMKGNISELQKAANGETVKTAPWFRETSIFSNAGVNFTSFAKSKQFGKDLYEDWLAPTLESNLLVETWPNGPGELPSNCTRKFHVNNIKTVYIKEAQANFTNTHDHSKWAVSKTTNWICIGDINRMEHQLIRGGGTVCLNNKILANIYKKSILNVEECKNALNNTI